MVGAVGLEPTVVTDSKSVAFKSTAPGDAPSLVHATGVEPAKLRSENPQPLPPGEARKKVGASQQTKSDASPFEPRERETDWMRGPESNRLVTVLRTAAFPFRHHASIGCPTNGQDGGACPAGKV